MSNLGCVNNIKDLSTIIHRYDPNIIVVEGYNAVGKGFFMEKLTDTFNMRVYRPDYTGWVSNVPREYRWVIFSSFVDMFNKLGCNSPLPILLDRGFFSGVVYNDDPSLAYFYSSAIGSERILQILVTCSEEDYNRYLDIRGSSKLLKYKDCLEYTRRYEESFQIAGADYVIYQNLYMDTVNYSDICAGCSHYTFYDNSCSNQLAIDNGIIDVSPNRKRCEYAVQEEIQDGKLQSL